MKKADNIEISIERTIEAMTRFIGAANVNPNIPNGKAGETGYNLTLAWLQSGMWKHDFNDARSDLEKAVDNGKG